MSSPIDKKTLERLAELARIELDPKEETKLLRDLTNILGHFEELRTLDTSHVAPLTGGTLLVNALREDAARENTNQGKGVAGFPERTGDSLKIPPVFE